MGIRVEDGLRRNLGGGFRVGEEERKSEIWDS